MTSTLLKNPDRADGLWEMPRLQPLDTTLPKTVDAWIECEHDQTLEEFARFTLCEIPPLPNVTSASAVVTNCYGVYVDAHKTPILQLDSGGYDDA